MYNKSIYFLAALLRGSSFPSAQRATVLSFDSLMGSSGGIFVQPILGKVADIWNYPLSYGGAALFQAVALPFILLARREKPKSDIIEK